MKTCKTCKWQKTGSDYHYCSKITQDNITVRLKGDNSRFTPPLIVTDDFGCTLHEPIAIESWFSREDWLKICEYTSSTPEDSEKPSDYLLESFIWANTEEGHEYWSKIDKDLESRGF